MASWGRGGVGLQEVWGIMLAGSYGDVGAHAQQAEQAWGFPQVLDTWQGEGEMGEGDP